MDPNSNGYVAYVATSWFTSVVLRVQPTLTTARSLLSTLPAPHSPVGVAQPRASDTSCCPCGGTFAAAVAHKHARQYPGTTTDASRFFALFLVYNNRCAAHDVPWGQAA